MTISEVFRSVQFVVDKRGERTAAVLDMQSWEAILSSLEEVEDVRLIRDRLADWRTKETWTPWEAFERELEADAVSPLDQK